MDDKLKAALMAPPEEREFHGATVQIRHMSANARLALIDELTASGKDTIDGSTAVEIYWRLIRDLVVGVTDDDCESMRNASFPRFEELAKLVMDVNGIGDQKQQAKN